MMKNTVSISFCKNQCHLTQISRDKDELSLTGVTSILNEGDILSSLSNNAHLIQPFLSKSTRVILILPSESVLLKNIVLDASLTDQEIIRHIESQSVILFGYSAEQLYFDYETCTIEENDRHILVAASHQKQVEPYLQCLDHLKISPDVIDVDVFSLLRLASPLVKEKNFVLLFHHENDLLIIEAHNKKLKKYNTIGLSSPETLPQLNSFLSIHHKIIVMSDHKKLKLYLEQLNFLYEEVTISLLFNALIQNKLQREINSLHPFLTSIGGGLWGNT